MSHIKTILDKHKIHAKKRLGQNFLTDQIALDLIVKSANLTKEDTVLEIGAGIGNLSTVIAEQSGILYAVEKDRRVEHILKKALKPYPHAEIILGDILKIDIKKIFQDKKIKVIGNLPYYITTPIINYLLDHKQYINSICITVQKEVAQRIVAVPGKKDFGRLSCLLQFYTKPEVIAVFPKTMFFPQPEVDSALIKLSILDKPSINVKSEKMFFNVVRAIFAQRRKTLINGLSNAGWNLKKEDLLAILEQLNISPSIRGESLSLVEIGKLSDEIFKSTT
ncbi:MAG: ribosomal RNA small subunit methyltransferase A [Candidatus Omnitrophica bacterium]|nr:ribosomal RNA small subunit methyltransferase A [Candidatus Omnitrophota bacterium]